MFLNIKLASALLLGALFLSGAAIAPRTLSAFVMGAWAGVLIAAPPLMILAFCLGLMPLRQLLAPLLKLPVLIVLTVGLLYYAGVDMGLGLPALSAGVVLWWARKGRHFIGL